MTNDNKIENKKLIKNNKTFLTMMKTIFSVVFVFILSLNAFSNNNDTTLLTIDGQKISSAEFLRIYNKNNNNNQIDNKSIKDYIDLYINYKLKVIEAEKLGLDTLKTFIDEYNGYIEQLQKPYLVDSSVERKIINETYERMKWEVRASHILLRCNENALPSDTLIVYNKIMKLRQQIINGEAFEKICAENSEENGAKETKGNLGYFGAFQMIYPFEIAAFNIKPGTVSMPVRTIYGYHLIKVWEKRPARGEVHVSHIMFVFPQGSPKSVIDSIKIKADSIYQKIKNGANFEQLAKQFSDDRQSGEKNGELPWFTTGQMVPEFEDAAFQIKEINEVIAPIKTQFGWHILKKLGSREIKSKEEALERIKTFIASDERANMGRKMLIEKIKKETGFIENKKNITGLYSIIDSTFFTGNWTPKPGLKLDAELFSFAGNKTTQKEFINYLLIKKNIRNNIPLRVIIDKAYNEYVEETFTNFEKSRLKFKYHEYRNLSQEYHDGILLFNLSDEKIWTKAMKDSTGLEAFYETNKNKYQYGQRANATIFSSSQKKYVEKAREMIIKDKKGKLTLTDINKKLCTKDTIKECVLAESGLFEKGAHQAIDTINWEPTISPVKEFEGNFVFYQTKEIRQAEPKSLDDSRGLHIADYQNYLETEWIKELRKKYTVVINEDSLKSLLK